MGHYNRATALPGGLGCVLVLLGFAVHMPSGLNAQATLTFPTTTGVKGGWSVEFNDSVAGARFIHPVNTDKDGAIVAARVASALGGLGHAATSDSRSCYINPTRKADATYVNEVAQYIYRLYVQLARLGGNRLLRKDTVVLTSVHRFGLYVAEALHAAVLPLQFISFADSWDQVKNASRSATLIVGQDYDNGGLWLWNKLAAGKNGTAAGNLPPAYLTLLQGATNVVVVQPCDNWVYCDPVSDPNGYNCWDAVNETWLGAGNLGPVYLHTSLTRSGFGIGKTLYDAAKAEGKIGKATSQQAKNLKQWEWGVPDTTLNNLRWIWTGLLKKSEANFKVISGGVVDMFGWTPDLWNKYLQANGLRPRGFHWNSYWAAHSQLERMGAILPFPSYSYWQPQWHPLDDVARGILGGLVTSDQSLKAYAPNSRAFVNNIGSAGDVTATKQVLIDFNMSPSSGLAYFGTGINCKEYEWKGWDGSSSVQPGYVEVASALQNATKAPYTKRNWVNLGFDALSSYPSTCTAWTQF